MNHLRKFPKFVTLSLLLSSITLCAACTHLQLTDSVTKAKAAYCTAMETALEIEIRFQEVAKDDPKLQPAYNKFIQVLKDCDAMLQPTADLFDVTSNKIAVSEINYTCATAHLMAGVRVAQEVLK
jgi:hypothetical protein